MLSVLLAQGLDVRVVDEPDLVAFLGPFDHLRHLLRNHRPFRGEGLVLHVVDFLDEPVALEKGLVVGGVVQFRHRCKLVEPLDEEALLVEVREPVGPGEGGHPLFARQGDYRIEQRLGHIVVVDDVEPSEAHVVRPVLVVGGVAENSRDASDDPPVPARKVQLRLRVLEGRIAARGERVELVLDERGDPVRVARVQRAGESDELLELRTRCNNGDVNFHAGFLTSFHWGLAPVHPGLPAKAASACRLPEGSAASRESPAWSPEA